jgi:ABC-type bacteriocin/lantibiotic exporter with double-glycine peptidase domain
MLLSLLISVTDIASIAFLFYVVNFYTPHHAALNFSFVSRFNIDPHSVLPVVFLFMIFIAKSLGGYHVYKAQQKLVNKVSSRISSDQLSQYMSGSYEEHVNIDSAVYIQKIYHWPIEFANYVLSGVQQIITELILVTLSVTALMIYDAKLVLIVSLVLLPAIAILSYLTRKRLTGIRKNIQVVNEKSLQYLNEALTGFVESNIYNKNKEFVNRYSNVQSVLNNYVADMQITQGLPSRFFEAFAVFGLFILVLAGQYGGSENVADIFKLGAFVAAAYKIIPGISRIINLGSVVKTYAYIVSELSIQAQEMQDKRESFQTKKIHAIGFDDVSFSYQDQAIFSGFNCNIRKGTFAGISGNSGKGKTTLVNLLLGFLTPTAGNISLNGEVAETTDRKLYWRKISYVKQEPFLFHDSILRNIVFFDDTYNAEKLQEVIESAGLNEFISQFPEGLEKMITENGKNISGGQRQRIAIARALYKEADVVILDEPFNELDEASEMKLMHYFKRLSETGKIVILITHSSNSLQYCDEVISLDEA